jgi:hypothetical protein
MRWRGREHERQKQVLRSACPIASGDATGPRERSAQDDKSSICDSMCGRKPVLFTFWRRSRVLWQPTHYPATCDCHHVGFLTKRTTCPGTGLVFLLTFVEHQIPPSESGLATAPVDRISWSVIWPTPHCSFLSGGYTAISICSSPLQGFGNFANPSLSVSAILCAELR